MFKITLRESYQTRTGRLNSTLQQYFIFLLNISI